MKNIEMDFSVLSHASKTVWDSFPNFRTRFRSKGVGDLPPKWTPWFFLGLELRRVDRSSPEYFEYKAVTLKGKKCYINSQSTKMKITCSAYCSCSKFRECLLVRTFLDDTETVCRGVRLYVRTLKYFQLCTGSILRKLSESCWGTSQSPTHT